MKIPFLYGKQEITLTLPRTALVYASSFTSNPPDCDKLITEAMTDPVGSVPLAESLAARREGKVVIVVSDITRPIPYKQILPAMLQSLALNGIAKEEITILIATGMHRASTLGERVIMFGEEIAREYRIIDHDAEDEEALAKLETRSWSGTNVSINKHYVEAGFRIITGLVEPHFMAGFSGGRKAICPGLASLPTVQQFHGYAFLSNPSAMNGNLTGNPCHLESSSVARAVPPDFSLNIILNNDKKVVEITGGEMELSHQKAIDFVKQNACIEVGEEADLVITSSGGFPLDATFYQCVKGFVSCLPAVKKGGEIVSFGGCTEGVGGPEYGSVMRAYANRWGDFLKDIAEGDRFTKDQWQFQMHCRALERVGKNNLVFFTGGLESNILGELSVNGQSGSVETLTHGIQAKVDKAVARGLKIAVFPEGPYCVPVERMEAS